jgi:hypothetical protein
MPPDPPAPIQFLLEPDSTDHPVVTLRIVTPDAQLMAMAEVVQVGRTLMLFGLHLHGVDTAPNQLGPAKVRAIANACLEVMDLDEILIAACLRTTGANPGRTTEPVRFARYASAGTGWRRALHLRDPGAGSARHRRPARQTRH